MSNFFGEFPFKHYAWGQALLYYKRVNTITKDYILGKAWEAQFTMLAAKKKCWAKSMKKWLFKTEPQEEVVGFLPPVQPSLETTHQLATTRALQARTAQSPLRTTLRTMHIHLTHLTRVRSWVESQVFWCNTHNVQMGVQMAKMVVLQLVQLVGVRSMT